MSAGKIFQRMTKFVTVELYTHVRNDLEKVLAPDHIRQDGSKVIKRKNKEGIMYCEKCGKQVEEGSRFCPYCGAANSPEPVRKGQEIPAQQENVKKERAKKESVKRKGKKLPVIIIAAVVVMILGIMVFSEGAGNSKGHVETMKDLSLYAGYTEAELVAELGYEKNEYGIYPQEDHMNFFFEDGRIYLMQIRSPEDVGMTLCGVGLKDSLEKADAVLGKSGFVKAGSYETNEVAADGSLDTVDVQVTCYTESGTGYPYYINSDMDGQILSLIYGLEAEEPDFTNEQEEGLADPEMQEEEETEDALAEEEQTETQEPVEELQFPATEPLTYGAYSGDDGTGGMNTAEVGFYTDETGGSYIYIECWRDDRAVVYFEGMLEENGDTYHAYCEEVDTSILVTFADGGLYVQIEDSDFTDIELLEGFYHLDTALNLDEVG